MIVADFRVLKKLTYDKNLQGVFLFLMGKQITSLFDYSRNFRRHFDDRRGEESPAKQCRLCGVLSF